MKYINLLFLFVICLYSCEEKDIESFNGKNSIFFEKFYENDIYGNKNADSTTISFFFAPESMQTLEANLSVCLSGNLLSEDVTFKLKVIEEETNANTDEYTIEDSYTFHKGTEDEKEIKDEIFVKVHKSQRIENNEIEPVLVVELVPNETLLLGQEERIKAKIIISNNVFEPEWWDFEVTNNLLGKFSRKKYKLFIEHADPEITLDAELIKNNPDKARQLAFKFKKWLSEQDPLVLDEDGTIMNVTI